MSDHGRMSKTVVRRVLLWGALAVVAIFLLFAWFQRPLSGIDESRGEVRLSGSCCARTTGAPDYEHFVLSEIVDDQQVIVSLGDLVWGYARIRDGQVGFEYVVSRNDTARSGGSDYSFNGEDKVYEVEGLTVGDAVTEGPVTIEVLAIHSMILSRNDAVDLRVTFDEEKLGEAP